MTQKTTEIRIDAGVAQTLRRYAFEKHGRLYGTIKMEAELAILNHIKRRRGEC